MASMVITTAIQPHIAFITIHNHLQKPGLQTSTPIPTRETHNTPTTPMPFCCFVEAMASKVIATSIQPHIAPITSHAHRQKPGLQRSTPIPTKTAQKTAGAMTTPQSTHPQWRQTTISPPAMAWPHCLHMVSPGFADSTPCRSAEAVDPAAIKGDRGDLTDSLGEVIFEGLSVASLSALVPVGFVRS